MHSRTAILGVFLLGLGAGLNGFLASRVAAAGLEEPVSQPARPWMPPVPGAGARTYKEPDLGLQQVFPSAIPRPVSEWLEKEKLVHSKLLVGQSFDTLVVPFQVTSWGFDRPTRALMTAELWLALSQATSWKMPNPDVVAKALGEDQRELDVNHVQRLAESINARRIIWTYAGHDQQGKMTIVLRRQELSGDRAALADPDKIVSLRDIPMATEAAPIEIYESSLPEVMRQLGLAMPTSLMRKSVSTLEVKELPASPAGLITSKGTAARDAYTLLLFRSLTPEMLGRTREMFAEKAYLALRTMAESSPEYRALRARTLLALGSREAALRALGAPRTDEERGVLAYANGDLPRLRELASREKNPLKRLLIKLDENRVATSYDVRNRKQSQDEAAALELPGQAWGFLGNRAFADGQAWAQFDNAVPKYLLDADYPVPGRSLREMVEGHLALGDQAKARAVVDLSVFDHVRRLNEADADQRCCSFAAGRLTRSDYLELLQAVAHDNLLRRITFHTVIQGRPATAIDFANSIDVFYKGHPYYAVVRAQAEQRLAINGGESRREGLLKSAYDHSISAMYWEQAQSKVSEMANRQLYELRRGGYGGARDPYYGDLPFHPSYDTLGGGAANKYRQAALRNATHEFTPVLELYEHYQEFEPSPKDIAELLRSIDGRFNGAPQKNDMLARQALSVGDRKLAKAYYSANTELAPGHWSSFRKLGEMLFQDGEVRGAAKVWSAYAGFRKDSDEHRVVIANNAYQAGSDLYWAGHFDLAESFYRISAAQRTGAASEISSATRLRLLAGDLAEALQGTLARAQRYDDTYAYRDYLGMLHAAGYSNEGWAGFGHLVRDVPQSPHVWETALVGHRREGASEADVVAWAKRPDYVNAGPDANGAAVYLLRFATTDRIPSVDLAEIINRLDRPVWRLEDRRGQVVRPEPDGRRERILGPDSFGGDSSLFPGVFAESKRRQVKSDLAYFAAGYRELRLRNFKAAQSIFDEAAGLYDLKAIASYMLPYYVHAQAMAGAQREAEGLLARFKPEEQNFDYLLAKAALASAQGRKDEALQSLNLARYRRPHTEKRPLLTQYTYGEFAEMLAEQSGDPRLLDVALDWARKFQKIEPWQAWSHAITARIAKNPAERGRAIAMTKYLDPGSLRLSRLRKAEIDQAERVDAKANPFLILRKRQEKSGES